MPHIPRDHVQPHIDAADKGLNLQHFRHQPRRCNEIVKRARVGLIQRETQAHLDLIAQRAPVQDRLLPLQHAFRPQPLQPPPTGRRRHPRPLRQIGSRQPGFGQQMPQDASISVVYLHDFSDN
ncbi:hypothetical protein GALL_446130 [mine drainage metagenome]|uniref:Uncharacterized protein n=1 Tax=mine drainage metagenome TaxID=410659 RepID=A0A1J5PQG8_9ZZZZ